MRGKEAAQYCGHSSHWDHPRACGEKIPVCVAVACTWGLPPRMRGKAVHHKHRHSPGRITPAYAGKRHHPEPGQSSSEDHPRMCGEKARLGRFWLSAWGSPPRMRGKANIFAMLSPPLRITPAYAGKRTRRKVGVQRRRDHPRVCGEKGTCA